MPTGIEEAITAITGAVGGAITLLQALASEPWTRYFVIVGALGINQLIGTIIGAFPLEILLTQVIGLFINGFVFPVYYGVSSLLVIAVIMPVIFYLIKTTISR